MKKIETRMTLTCIHTFTLDSETCDTGCIEGRTYLVTGIDRDNVYISTESGSVAVLTYADVKKYFGIELTEQLMEV